ncbi:MAG: hypothetical protein ACFFBP_06750 [Promethearchaeota archaeon]
MVQFKNSKNPSKKKSPKNKSPKSGAKKNPDKNKGKKETKSKIWKKSVAEKLNENKATDFEKAKITLKENENSKIKFRQIEKQTEISIEGNSENIKENSKSWPPGKKNESERWLIDPNPDMKKEPNWLDRFKRDHRDPDVPPMEASNDKIQQLNDKIDEKLEDLAKMQEKWLKNFSESLKKSVDSFTDAQKKALENIEEKIKNNEIGKKKEDEFIKEVMMMMMAQNALSNNMKGVGQVNVSTVERDSYL